MEVIFCVKKSFANRFAEVTFRVNKLIELKSVAVTKFAKFPSRCNDPLVREGIKVRGVGWVEEFLEIY